MKASSMLVFTICASMALAARGVSAQESGKLSHITLSAVGQNLDYEETASGSTLDSDKGAMWGATAEWRQDMDPYLLIVKTSYAATESAVYDGSLQYSDGTTVPYSAGGQKESIWLLQADLGYKYLRSGGMTLSPLVGLGYRDWLRGQNDIANGNYKEDYHWFFVDGGVDFDFQTGNWLFGFQGKAAYPLAAEMVTDVAGTYPTMSFSLGSVLSYFVTGTIRYRFPSSDPAKRFYVAMSPFFEHWGLGASAVNQYGIYEPDSSTNIFGLTLGFGMDAGIF